MIDCAEAAVARSPRAYANAKQGSSGVASGGLGGDSIAPPSPARVRGHVTRKDSVRVLAHEPSIPRCASHLSSPCQRRSWLQHSPPDLIVTNARIYTVDAVAPSASDGVVGTRAVRRVRSRRAGVARATHSGDRSRGAHRRPGHGGRACASPWIGDGAAHGRPYRNEVVRRGHRPRGRPSPRSPSRDLDPRARLGPERLGRHALSVARSLVARRSGTSSYLRGSMAMRLS